MRKSVFWVTAVFLLGMASVVPAQVLVPADHAAAGVKVLVPDTVFFKSTVPMGTYWEPFTDFFGDGTIILIAGAYPEGLTAGFNSKVAFINVDGTIQEYWAFYTDKGQPYTGGFNETRKDGNPPRVAADRRPGGILYVTGQEATPYMYETEFNTDGRWDKLFVYVDRQVAVVQGFMKTPAGPQMLTKVTDPVYGSGTIEGGQIDQMRYGGDISFLSDGNILAVVEDRNKVIVPSGNGAVATIFNSQTGAIIKGPFNSAGDDAAHSIWANVAAFKGGFAVRTEGITTIYDNAGNKKFVVAQADWTTVKDAGRGDGTRICSNIASDYICILGKNADGDMVVSRLNAQTGKADKEVVVEEEDLWLNGTFDRGDVAMDEYDNVCAIYQWTSSPAQAQIVARVLNSNLEPATPTFYAFNNFERPDAANLLGFVGKEPNVSMNNSRIMIAADGVTLDSTTNALTLAEHAFAIVLENPLKKATDVETWELY
ncbi:MAG: hypothetical protein AB1656_15470 [Candidatus Omnitrophota bacterium]